MPVSTRLHSNHTTGGGTAFGFKQINPPGPLPYELANAITMYSDWSNAQMPEALPDLREYVIDRTNLSSIGNFTIHALRARKAVHCYGQDIHIVSQPSDLTSGIFRVKTSEKFGGGYMGKTSEVLLQFGPNQLTLWADDYRIIRDSRVVTKLVFAIINGTIENGKHNQYQQMIDTTCMGAYGQPCSGISAIACDVDVDVTEERVCNGRCEGATSKGKALTSLQTTFVEYAPAGLALYLGAIPTVIGQSVYGAQPMWRQGNYEQNSSYALPMQFLDFWTGPPITEETQHWSIGNLTNFINVTAGALGIQLAKAYPQGWTIVESTLDVPRLSPQRSFLLLAPPAVILLCVVILALLSSIIHKRTGVDSMRLGSTSEFLVHCANDELRSLVNSVRAGDVEAELLDKKSLRFGQLADGQSGLGSNVESFILKRRPT